MREKPVAVKELKRLQYNLQAAVHKVNAALAEAADLGVKVNVLQVETTTIGRTAQLVLTELSVPLSLIYHEEAEKKGE